ncbi:MAG: acetyl-CoA carboxylase biotin carboxyl carrier protein [Armatimonadota bacterium]
MDIAKIEELIQVLESSRTEELLVRKGEVSVHIRKGQRPSCAVSSSAQPEACAEAADEQCARDYVIRAPMVGIFHAVDGVTEEGAHISAGQVVGAIESMKLLNDVIAEVSGVVRETMVEDGMPVEYGQPLCRIEPDSG